MTLFGVLLHELEKVTGVKNELLLGQVDNYCCNISLVQNIVLVYRINYKIKSHLVAYRGNFTSEISITDLKFH